MPASLVNIGDIGDIVEIYSCGYVNISKKRIQYTSEILKICKEKGGQGYWQGLMGPKWALNDPI